MDEKVNYWKLLSYVISTWVGISIIAKILVIFYSENPEHDLLVVTAGLYGFASLFLGVIMAYKLKKKIEFVYGFVLFFIAPTIIDLSFIVGLPLILSYFGGSYIKLENQRLSKRIPEPKMDKKVNIWKIFVCIIITWFAVATLARILIELDPNEYSDAQSMIWAYLSVVLGLVMEVKLKKIIEFVYGAFFFFISLSFYLGMFLAIIYFARCYYELEQKNLGTVRSSVLLEKY